MATIGTLAVNVIANTGGLAGGMGKATGIVQRFSQTGISGLGGFATAAAGLVGVGLSAAAAVSAIGDAMGRIDSTLDLSNRIGETTENLQRMRYAAQLNGSSAEQMDKGLEKMTRTLGDAMQGSNTAQEAFWRLGLPISALNQMSPAEQFAAIGDAINALPTPAERAAAAVDIFGKSGQQLINTLQLGREGLRAMGEESDRVQGILTNADASKVAEAADAIDKMKFAIEGAANSAAVTFAPAIETVANAVSGIVGWIRTAGQGLADLVDPTAAAAREKQRLAAAQAQATQQAQKNSAVTVEAERGAAAARKAHEDAMKRGASLMKDNRTPFEAYNATLADLQSLLRNGAIDQGTFGRAAAKARAEFENDSGLTKAAEKQQEALDKMRDRAKSVAEAIRTPLQEAQAKVAELNQLVEAGMISWDVYRKSVAGVKKELSDAQQKAREAQLGKSEGPGGALRRGSTAAFSAAESSRREMQAMAQGQKSQLDETKKTNTLLGEIKTEVAKPGQRLRVLETL